ncbi:Endo-1,4-beta-xylanase A precursor [compost metagenome]
MALAARALAAVGKQSEGSGALDAYADAASISDYAKDYVAAMVRYGIVSGKDDKIAPTDPLSRAEAAAILYRIWNL